MRFIKPALTVEQQVAHLQSRGMLGEPAKMRRCLESVNYYRLSAYWHTFRERGGEAFLAGTDFEVVWARYVFDRELRLLVMDAIERFEIAVRTRLAYEHALAGGPFGYDDGAHAIWRHDPHRRAEFRQRLVQALHNNRKEPFIEHFRSRYGAEHAIPPVWVVVEVLMFGDLLSFYRGSDHSIREGVARYFGVADRVFDSWLLTMNVVRNLCAHHARLWNRKLGVQPLLPRDTAWHHPVAVRQERVFAVLTILADAMHRIAPGSTWAARLRDHIEGCVHVPLDMMGFPEDWKQVVIWQRAWAGAGGVG